MHDQPSSAFAGRFKALPVWVQVLAIVGIVSVAFSPSLSFDFISYDDPEFIIENPRVNSGLSPENTEWAFFPAGEVNLWNPLSYLSHQLDVSLFGLSAGWHHATSVFWHALAAGLLFLLSRRLTGSSGWACLVALLWALHPQRVQSVAWVSERKDVLSGALFFASILLFSRWWARTPRPVWLYLSSLLLFIAAALAKPSVLPLPLVLLVLFGLKRGDMVNSCRSLVRPLAPFFAISIIVAGFVIYFQSQGTLSEVGHDQSVFERARQVVISYGFYPVRFFWPTPSRLLFRPSDFDGLFVAALVGLAAMVIALIWFGRKSKLVSLGAMVYTLLWLPTSGVIPVSHYFVADRYSYLPQIGLIMMLVGLVRGCIPTVPTVIKVSSLTAFLALQVVLLQRQLPVWQNSKTLFGHEMAVNPQSSMAAIHYGKVFEKEDPEMALAYFRKAHQLADAECLPLTQMGLMLLRLDRKAEAFESFTKAVKAENPVAEAWNRLLVLQVEKKLYQEADATVKEAEQMFPASWAVMMNAGNYHLRVRNDPKQALRLFLKAREIKPNHPDTIDACAVASGQLERRDEASGLLDGRSQ